MNSRVTALAALLLLMLVGASSAQDKSQVICKGASVPEGFVVSGEDSFRELSTATMGLSARWL
jgi:hypothetical protein